MNTQTMVEKARYCQSLEEYLGRHDRAGKIALPSHLGLGEVVSQYRSRPNVTSSSEGRNRSSAQLFMTELGIEKSSSH
jgi:hypothetical protein